MDVILDSMAIADTANTNNNLTWNFKDKERYNIVGAFRKDIPMFDFIRTFSLLFMNCDTDHTGQRTQGSFHLLRIEKVLVLGEPNSEIETYGLFIRMDSPVWVQEIVYEFMAALVYMNNSPLSPVEHVVVNTTATFDAWLGEHPLSVDFREDFLLLQMNASEMKNTLDMFSEKSYGWKITSNIIPVILKVRSVADGTMRLVPLLHFSKMVSIALNLPLAELKNLVVTGQIGLVSSTSLNI